jgi:uncharacterized protein YprB with RNaseH-like and TPR domain
MTVSLQKLRALRRQVGSTSVPPEKAGGNDEAVPRPAQASAIAPRAGEAASPLRPAGAAGSSRLPAVAPALVACANTPASNHPPMVDRQSIRPASPREGTGTAAHSIDSLRRLLGVRARTVVPLPTRGPIDRSLPGTEIAPGLRLVEAHLPMALPTEALSLAFAARVAPKRSRSPAVGVATPHAADPHDLLFFDTETTGLAGGTGTRAFMIGAADFHQHPEHGAGLRVRQLLIAAMAAEADMLHAFAGWLSPRTVLASYNGRCYDAPLLKTRYRLARLADPLHGLAHVDLLFPSRRRWRGRWENCRLATIEREALGVLREDDLPGSQAPTAWLQYLRGGSSSLLRRVGAHNHQDVVSLALLMMKLVALHAEEAMGAG